MKLRAIALATALLCTLPPQNAKAIPVIDVANLAQAIINAVENANQTVTALRQYRNELLQYQEIVRNTVATPVYIYDRIDFLQKNIEGLVKDLANYRSFLDEIEDWMGDLKDLEYYRTARCYGSDAYCTVPVWQRILQEEQRRAEVDHKLRKDSMDALMVSINDTDARVHESYRSLQILKEASRGAEGQLQAVQAGNELAAAEIQELLQIRAALNAYHRVLLLEKQVALDREGRARARSERYFRKVYVAEDKGVWNFDMNTTPRNREARTLLPLLPEASGYGSYSGPRTP